MLPPNTGVEMDPYSIARTLEPPGRREIRIFANPSTHADGHAVSRLPMMVRLLS
jgi:hypothetical protein